MQINAFTSDINFKRVRAGYRPLEDCQGKERIPFCLGSEFAERGAAQSRQSLYLTVLQRRYDDGVLKEGEIRRIPIRFR